jgi:AcrR family transcriptional regulator
MSTRRPRRPTTSRRPALATARARLSASARRQQLLDTAASLLTREGIDGLQLTRIAAAAGVTRPIVYKYFPSRQALIMGVLEDLEGELGRRFAEVFSQPLSGDLAESARKFIDAVCDAIEAKGVGSWELLASRGPDPDVARLAHAIHARLLAPWHARIAQATGITRREAQTASRMLVAAARAALEEWYTGATTRERATRDATLGVSALLAAFAERRERARRRR